jgi:hypothetical protein
MAGFERSAKKAAIQAGKSAKAFGERTKVAATNLGERTKVAAANLADKVTGKQAKRTKTKRVMAAVGAAAAVVVAGVAVRRARKNAKRA